jgi:hypothetical protein
MLIQDLSVKVLMDVLADAFFEAELIHILFRKSLFL